jgi:ribose 1,5-bisphosphokinase PhnN
MSSFHFSLQGVLTLKNTYFEPRYVLVSPVTPSIHERRLEERGMYGAAHIHATLQRALTYADYNLQHPGFFDMMINSGEWERDLGLFVYTHMCMKCYK